MNGQMDLYDAIRLAESGAKLASEYADRVTPGEVKWSEQAYSFLRLYMVKCERFQGEDVRLAANGVVPLPPDPRAWGRIIQIAAREGIIRSVGYEPISDPKGHGRPMRVWEVVKRAA